MTWHLHAYHAAWTVLFVLVVLNWGWLPLATVYLVLGIYCFWRA